MPRTSPYTIRLTTGEAAELPRRAAKYTLPYFQVQRAKIALLAAEGLTNEEIATRLDTRREVVWLWRKRFFSERLAVRIPMMVMGDSDRIVMSVSDA